MKKIVLMLLVVVVASMMFFPPCFAKTLETTELSFQLAYMYTMGQFTLDCQYEEISRSEDNDREVLSLLLTDYTSAVLTMDDSLIESIIHIGAGDGTEYSGLTISCSMIATMLAVDPSITPSIALDILSELQSSSDPYETEYCSYQFAVDKDIGAILTVEPV